MTTLYEISNDLHAIEALLGELDGELPEGELGEALDQWFADALSARDQKLDNMAALIRQFEVLSDAADAEAARLYRLAAARTNAAKRLKERVKAFMQEHGLTKLQTPRFTLSVASNGGVAPLVVPDAWKQDPLNAPASMRRATWMLDTAAIRQALASGDAPDGVAIGERGNHLRIK